MWDDEPFLALSPGAKAVFSFSFQHDPGASMTGLSVVSEKRLRRVICASPLASEHDLHAVLDELGVKPFVKYDYDRELLWCVNRAVYVYSQSPKYLKGLRRHVERMPKASPIIDEFRSRYEALVRDGNAAP
jgi:hypothetical protein